MSQRHFREECPGWEAKWMHCCASPVKCISFFGLLKPEIRLLLVDFMKGAGKGLMQRHRVKHWLTPFQYRLAEHREGSLRQKSCNISVSIRRRIREVRRRILVINGQRKPVYPLSLCRLTAKSCFEDHLGKKSISDKVRVNMKMT